MVQTCCVVGCFNKAAEGCQFSFLSFPWKSHELMTKWLTAINRKEEDGTDWYPTKFSRVCSAHFLDSDFYMGLKILRLREEAVPSVFPRDPQNKEICQMKNPGPPTKRSLQNPQVCEMKNPGPSTKHSLPNLSCSHSIVQKAKQTDQEQHSPTKKNVFDMTKKKQNLKKKDTRLQEEKGILPSSCSPLVVKIAKRTGKNGHSNSHPSVQAHLDEVQGELIAPKEKVSFITKEKKSLKKKDTGREKTITSLLGELKEANILGYEEVELLLGNFDSKTLTLIENEIKATETSSSNMHYSEDLKSFAVSLHFYSAQAYEYVRKHLHLPPLDSIRKWMSTLNAQPGFFTEVLQKLENEVTHDPDKKDVCLIFDSMSLQKQIVYDQTQQANVGYVNHGLLQVEAYGTMASESLMFLVVGLKKFFKYPIGYFLVDKISAAQLSQLIEQAICLLTKSGVDVHALVCDGAYSNQAAARALGCKIMPEELSLSIQNPVNPETPIFFVFDVCHLMENVRSCLADTKIFYAGENRIEWRYIAQLHDLQLENSICLCNKLKEKHIEFNTRKLIMSTAVLTLSSNVACVIEFLRDELMLPEFLGSEETCNFLRIFDKIFNLCNGRNHLAKGFSSAINTTNLMMKLQVIKQVCLYIRSLKDITGRPLINGRRKTGFLGLLTTLKSLQGIAVRLLAQGYRSILTYRLAQDHLESLFNRIRHRGGWRDNPNVLQFQSALRDLLQKNGVLHSETPNCTEVRWTLDKSPDESQLQMGNGLFSTEPLLETEKSCLDKYSKFLQVNRCKGPYHQHILHCVSGDIVKKLQATIQCSECSGLLTAESSCPSHISPFMQKCDRCGLLYASQDVLAIVSKTDEVLRRRLASGWSLNILTILKVMIDVTAVLGCQVFQSHTSLCHFESEDSHPVQVIKQICKLFCTIFLNQNVNRTIFTQ